MIFKSYALGLCKSVVLASLVIVLFSSTFVATALAAGFGCADIPNPDTTTLTCADMLLTARSAIKDNERITSRVKDRTKLICRKAKRRVSEVRPTGRQIRRDKCLSAKNKAKGKQFIEALLYTSLGMAQEMCSKCSL